jgi:outer membrane protein TolC
MRTFFRHLLEGLLTTNLNIAAKLAKPILTSILLMIDAEPSSAQSALTLQDAIKLAVTNRHELVAGEDRIQSAEQIRRQATLLPNPKLFFQLENLNNGPSFDFGQQADTYTYFLPPIEISGQRSQRISVASQTIRKTVLEQNLARRDILFNVRQACWSALSGSIT